MKDNKELDEAGKLWYEAKQNNDTAVKKMQEMIIFNILVKECKGDDKKIEAVSEFYIKNMEKYNPETKSLSAFFTAVIKFREIDIHNETEMREKTEYKNGKREKGKLIGSLNIAASDDDDETEKLDLIEGKGGIPEDLIAEMDRFEEIIILLSGLLSKLQGKADNDKKRLYYKLFLTDTLTVLIRNEGLEILKRREQDIMNGIYFKFLDYFMEDECRSLNDIFIRKIKKYIRDELNNKEIEVKDVPIKNPVYVSYLANEEDLKVRDSAVSEQHRAYKELLKQLILI